VAALRPRAAGLLLLSMATFTICGCRAGSFSATGVVSSDGGPLGRWSVRPDGCSVAPFDGLPVGKSTSVAQMIWERRKVGWTKVDADKLRWHKLPYLLDLSRSPGELSGVLKMNPDNERVTLDGSVCRTLHLDSNPAQPAICGGPASLDGHLVLDCMVKGSHITGDVQFRNCLL